MLGLLIPVENLIPVCVKVFQVSLADTIYTIMFRSSYFNRLPFSVQYIDLFTPLDSSGHSTAYVFNENQRNCRTRVSKTNWV